MHKEKIGCRLNVIYYSIIDAPHGIVAITIYSEEGTRWNEGITSGRTDDWKIAWGDIECLH